MNSSPAIVARPVSGVVGSSPAPARNPALDGLRGLAVLAVIAYHLWPQVLPGGFLGVDLFFVLSGYLITCGLLRRLDAGLSVGLRGFWIRRARRLVPAMLLMLVGTTALAILAGGELPTGLRAQWLGALSYTSNWLQIASGNSYFASAEPPYFQHLWSLAIEEQFYLLWPVVLVLLVVVLRTKTKLFAAVAILGVAAAASMAWAFVPGQDASPLYFGTWTHGFGLLFGSAAAIYASSRSSLLAPCPLARAGRTEQWAVGLLLVAMLVAMFLLPDTSAAAYRGGMALFCVAAAAMILSLERRHTLVRAVLNQQHLRWMGNRSYGLYLWHWPLLVLAGVLFPPRAATAATLCVLAATFLAAAASWHLVEQPIMRDGFRTSLRALQRNVEERREVLFSGMPGRYGQIMPLAALLLIPMCAATVLVTSPGQSSLQRQLTEAQEMLGEQAETPDIAPAPEAQSAPFTGKVDGKAAASEKGTHATGRDVTALGDSVMLASTRELLKELPGISIHASVGAQIREAPEKLERLRDANRLRRVVVLGLGTNGDLPAGTLEKVRDVIGPDRELLLVTVHAPRDWADSVNEKYRSAAAKYANVHLVDWAGLAPELDDFARDRIHPGPRGTREYARLMSSALASS
ncbi:acyltransferase family protein [Paeniglutamicibacter sp. NPDC091659]|uniref:acyltransferase family protein n=1 Tax=Paeniglutamicibacter sp. NPDC091659 TaxID=3364389 RepID=UPI0038295E4F